MGTGICAPIGVANTLRCALGGVVGLAILVSAAHAQLVPSTSAASAPATDAMERAQRQADNVMRWIRVHADKPRAAPAKPVPVPTAPKATAIAAPVSEQLKPVAVASPEPLAPAPTATLAVPVPPVEQAVPASKEPDPEPEPPEEEEAPLKAIALEQPTIPSNVLLILNAPSKIMVQFTVETNGSVSDIKVISSGRSQLNKPTIAAISKWRFEPIKVPRVQRVEFTFAP